jgi:hypothetical protein
VHRRRAVAECFFELSFRPAIDARRDNPALRMDLSLLLPYFCHVRLAGASPNMRIPSTNFLPTKSPLSEMAGGRVLRKGLAKTPSMVLLRVSSDQGTLRGPRDNCRAGDACFRGPFEEEKGSTLEGQPTHHLNFRKARAIPALELMPYAAGRVLTPRWARSDHHPVTKSLHRRPQLVGHCLVGIVRRGRGLLDRSTQSRIWEEPILRG